MLFDALEEREVVGYVREALRRGSGGRIVSPGIDVLRRAHSDATVRGYLDGATLLLAPARPLVWASRLAGRPLPAALPAGRLARALAAGLARDGRSVFLLGGDPGGPSGAPAAERAAAFLLARYPGLRIAGWFSPQRGLSRGGRRLSDAGARVAAAAPDLVLAGLGFADEQRLISRLGAEMPGTWFLGCGGAIDALAGGPAGGVRRPGGTRGPVPWLPRRRRAAGGRPSGRRSLVRARRELSYLISLYADAAHARARRRSGRR